LDSRTSPRVGIQLSCTVTKLYQPQQSLFICCFLWLSSQTV